MERYNKFVCLFSGALYEFWTNDKCAVPLEKHFLKIKFWCIILVRFDHRHKLNRLMRHWLIHKLVGFISMLHSWPWEPPCFSFKAGVNFTNQFAQSAKAPAKSKWRKRCYSISSTFAIKIFCRFYAAAFAQTTIFWNIFAKHCCH